MDRNNELVSVVIPAYNSGAYIRKCVQSLLGQTYDNIEIIIVNDGSIDNTLDICKELEKKDRRVCVIDKKNAGVAAARNVGLNCIKGNYCTFVDSDDYVEPQFIEKMLSSIIIKRADVCVCGFVDEDEQGIVFHQSEILSEDEYLVQDLTSRNFFPYVCWQIMFKSSLLKGCDKEIRFDERFSIKEDMLFINDIMTIASKVVVISDILYHSVSRDGSLTAGLYDVTSWNKYKKSIYVYEVALNNAIRIPALQKKVCYETLKEIVHMRAYMKKNKIEDKEIFEYLKKLKKNSIKVFINNRWEIRETLILLLLIVAPMIYCRIKKR